ncbi:MAG: hypothetical protein HQL17_06765 [Candidatus Omnitrophica bacterium]|nr:hypothetical protein [Candidatus Omnitrophota bacterium]
MSKTIKQSILILGVLVALSVAFAIVFYLQKQTAERRAVALTDQVTQLETKERETKKKLKELTDESTQLRADLDQRTGERDALTQKSLDAQKIADGLKAEMVKIKKDSGDAETKLANIRREREALMQQLTDLRTRPVPEKVVEKIVYRDRPAEGVVDAAVAPKDGVPATQAMNEVFEAAASSTMPRGTSRESETYWAGVLRQKADLEIQLQKMKETLNNSSVQMAELKKVSSDLEMEVGRLKNEKDEIIRKIKYGEDLADNLSVELARARNEQKISQDRAEQMLGENQQLRLDIKQLTTTKVALEKSIANLSEEKNGIEKKLVETENVIQGRIDEIWQIKKDIDVRFDNKSSAGVKTSNEVELAPIVVGVNKNEPVTKVSSSKSAGKVTASSSKKLQGSVVSVNDENNFVIVDLGEKSGVKVGDAFKVYHNGAQIGAVEVIQVRQDISAADIKQKVSPFAVGDTLR